MAYGRAPQPHTRQYCPVCEKFQDLGHHCQGTTQVVLTSAQINRDKATEILRHRVSPYMTVVENQKLKVFLEFLDGLELKGDR